jgi:hypothetical protein
MGDFLSLVYSRPMQLDIHLVGKRTMLPCVLERIEPFPPALGARPVPRRKGHGLVEKEQFRIAPLGHHDPVPAPEFHNTCDPSPAFVRADNFPLAIVQSAAPIAHHRPARVRPEQVAEGIDAVLQGHSEGIRE